MKLTRVIAIAVIGASLGLGVVNAQSFSALDAPAEFPPSDYKGKQYVDSRGCVYIRAGIDGNTNWVPRVTRDRKVICGFKPTLENPGSATIAPPKMDKDVVQIKPASPEKPTASSSSVSSSTSDANAASVTTKPATKITSKSTGSQTGGASKASTMNAAANSGSKASKTTTKTNSTAKPKTTVSKAPKTTTFTTTPQPRRPASQTSRASGGLSPCRDGVKSYKGFPVRCGPQSQSPVTPGTGNPTAPPPKMQFDQQGSLAPGTPGQVVRVGEVNPDTRVVPRHVYENNLVSHFLAEVPTGYRRAFDDGRLNPYRAEMTFTGKASMDRIWAEKVPRTLKRRRAGEEIVYSTKSILGPTQYEPKSTVLVKNNSIAAAPVISTKSTPATKSLRLSGTPYVQIGNYSSAELAQKIAQDIRRLGLPVRIGRYEKAGVVQRIVLAGPYENVSSSYVALARAREAGFTEAFVRN